MEPKIRFKGFEGEWIETSLSNLSSNFKYGINAAAVSFDGENKYLRITDIDDTMHSFLQNDVTSPGTDLSCCDEYLMQDGDIVIARTGASVGKSYIYHPFDGKVYFAGFLIRMRLNENTNRDFVFQNTLTNAYAKHVQFVSQRSGQPGINVNELQAYKLRIPSLSEQQFIATYFRTLDNKIQSTSKKLASLKKLKSASLVAMFPQQGETTPKVRFKGFEGEWKKVKFLEIFEFLKNNSLSRAELSSKGDFINIHYGDILIKYGDLVNIQNEELTYIRDCRIGQTLYKMCSLQNGDIIIADAAEDYSVGKCSEIVNIGNNKVVSGLHTIPCRPLITFAQGYLGHYINSNSYHNQLLPLIQGSKISSISKKTLSQTSVFVPSYEEQQSIATFFRSLDRKIALETARLEKLKQIKLACLDKMFV